MANDAYNITKMWDNVIGINTSLAPYTPTNPITPIPIIPDRNITSTLQFTTITSTTPTLTPNTTLNTTPTTRPTQINGLNQL